MSSRYYSYYKSDQHKNYTIKLMKYLQKNNIQFKDLDDPFFHLEGMIFFKTKYMFFDYYIIANLNDLQNLKSQN